MSVVIKVIGASGTGKTTFIERVLPALSARGVSVATVKHAPHGFTVDKAGSDSSRHRAAGADPVVLVGPEGTVRFSSHETGPEAIVAGIDGVDMVLVEGFTSHQGPTVLIHRHGFEPRFPPDTADVVVALTDVPLGFDNEIGNDDIDAAVEVLISLLERGSEPEVSLSVDGVPIELGGFVARSLSATVDALVGSLKGVAGDRRVIDLQVRPRDHAGDQQPVHHQSPDPLTD